MDKVKRIFLLMIITAFMILQSCGNPENISIKLLGETTIDHITMIKVTAIPLYDVKTADPNDIERIANYFNSINPADSRRNLREVAGMRKRIEFLFDDDTTNTIILSGSLIMIDDGPTQELSHDETACFNIIIGEILLNQYREENIGKRDIITGEVLSVSSDESGASIGCKIKTDENKIIEVSINSAKIIDISGGGRLILHVGDKVEIGLMQNTNNFIAGKVFITQ
jgi:hypothetical protein